MAEAARRRSGGRQVFCPGRRSPPLTVPAVARQSAFQPVADEAANRLGPRWTPCETASVARVQFGTAVIYAVAAGNCYHPAERAALPKNSIAVMLSSVAPAVGAVEGVGIR